MFEEMRPSEIFYSQDSINRWFGRSTRHRNVLIGHTLDELCENRCHPSAIPTITVLRKAGKWFTDCNRRLWVFRHLERHGKCETIPVILGTEISTRKMSTTNGGTEIRIRNGSPGGEWYMKPTPILNTGIGQTERNDDNQEELRSAVSPSTPETCNLKIGVKNENMNVTRGKRRKKDELPVTNRYCLRSTTLLQRQHPYNLRSHVRKPSK